MERYFEVVMKIGVKRNLQPDNYVRSCVWTHACITSFSNLLHIAENVVAEQCPHVTLDSCEKHMVEPSKDRKFRYWEGTCASVIALSL